MKTPSICVSLRGNTADSIIKDANLAKELGADLVEITLDSLYVRKIKNKFCHLYTSPSPRDS